MRSSQKVSFFTTEKSFKPYWFQITVIEEEECNRKQRGGRPGVTRTPGGGTWDGQKKVAPDRMQSESSRGVITSGQPKNERKGSPVKSESQNQIFLSTFAQSTK